MAETIQNWGKDVVKNMAFSHLINNQFTEYGTRNILPPDDFKLDGLAKL